MRLFIAFCFTLMPGIAATWTGSLVDAKCYQTIEQNHSPTDTETYVDRDKDMEIRFCRPKAKTRAFAVVDFNGQSFTLDAAGNLQATELVRNAAKGTRRFSVTVTGEMSKNTVKVDSLVASK